MTFTSTDTSSIFENGKLKAGTYMIQNLYSEGYVDIHEHSREMCCRPVQELREGRGIWEIKPLGAGYTVRRVEAGKPEQFCTPMVGLKNYSALSVAAYPVAWRVEVVNDDAHRGFEYVRFYWGITKMIWDIEQDKRDETSPVQLWEDGGTPYSWWIWRLLPVKAEKPDLDSLPSYDRGATEQSPTRLQHVQSEHDGFGTIVTEVTTTTVTTHKRYRVEDA